MRFPTIIPFDENNDMFKALKAVMSIDNLHEHTYEKKKNELGELMKKWEDLTIKLE